MAMNTKQFNEGIAVWLPDKERIWHSAIISSRHVTNDKSVHLDLIIDDTKKTTTVKLAKEADLGQIHLKNPPILVGGNDLTELSYLHEPAVLYNLRFRFIEKREIYTYCGIVLIAFNPYFDLSLYGNDLIDSYWNEPNVRNLEPHIFAVGQEAISRLSRGEGNQSIIVSGESGAGKTVSAKHVMRYLASVTGQSEQTDVEKRVLAANPLLEAIGNAKTRRNDNSSRFGKFTQLRFAECQFLAGAEIDTYLLERSRVVTQGDDERNYHIFYQLISAANSGERMFHDLLSLQLPDADFFTYLNQGDCLTVSSIDDVRDFKLTCDALGMLGFMPQDRFAIWQIITGVLYLGNIQYDPDSKDCCALLDSSNDAIEMVCEHLQLDSKEAKQEFKTWLCSKEITVGAEIYRKPFSLIDAVTSRDSLAKRIYGQLFDWLVSHLNACLQTVSSTPDFIGVLDIYGFETFDINSFEQLCINYANEKLQQQFNLHVFKLEQELYKKEGIPWTFIEFHDNQEAIDLIDGKMGMFDLLEEECKMPRGSDDTWRKKVAQTHERSTLFKLPKIAGRSSFRIKHFADVVDYDAEGFLEKSRDRLNEQLVNVFKQSKSNLLLEILATSFSDSAADAKPPVTKRSRVSSVGAAGNRSGPIPHKSASGTKHTKTMGLQFRESLKSLMLVLNATTPHYVRCIKPNDQKAAFSYDVHRAAQQLRACGVLETVRISAAGYPSRWKYEDFYSRYGFLLTYAEHERFKYKEMTSLVCTKYLKSDGDGPANFELGYTIVFFRTGQVANLEQKRLAKRKWMAVQMQRVVRGFLGRRKAARRRDALVTIQRAFRANLIWRRVHYLRMQRAATKIQAFVRMLQQRKRYLLVKKVVLGIQATWKGRRIRQQFEQLRHQRLVVNLQRHIRGRLARRSFKQKKSAVVFLQCCWRRWLARRELKTLKLQARSIEHVKTLNKGLEIKIISLQEKNNDMTAELREKRAQLKDVEDIKIQMQELKDAYNVREKQFDQLMVEVDVAKKTVVKKTDECDLIKEKLSEKDRIIDDLYEKIATLKTELEHEKGDMLKYYKRMKSAEDENWRLEEELKKERNLIENRINSEPVYSADGPVVHKATDADTVSIVTRLQQAMHKQFEENQRVCERFETTKVKSEVSESLEHGDPYNAYRLRQECQELRMENEKLSQEMQLLLKAQNVESTLRVILSKKGEESHRRREESSNLRGILASMIEESVDRKEHQRLSPRDAESPMSDSTNSVTSQLSLQKHMELIAENKRQKKIIQKVENEMDDKDDKYEKLLKEIIRLREENNSLRKRDVTPDVEKALETCVNDEINRITVANLDLLDQVKLHSRNERRLQRELESLRGTLGDTDVGDSGDNHSAVQNGARNSVISEQKFLGLIQVDDRHIKSVMANLVDNLSIKDALEMKPKCLPGYIVFMVLRYTDSIDDEPLLCRWFYLFMERLKAKTNSPKSHGDMEMQMMWLSNAICLFQLLRQYRPDITEENVPVQMPPESQLHYAMESMMYDLYCCLNIVYKNLLDAIAQLIKPKAVAAILEHEGIDPGKRPSGGWFFGRSDSSKYALSSLIGVLQMVVDKARDHGLPEPVLEILLMQSFSWISNMVLTTLMVKSQCCNWNKATQIKFNLTSIEAWLSEQAINKNVAAKSLAAVKQVAEILMHRKTMKDINSLCDIPSRIKTSQVVKILNMYRPAEGENQINSEFVRAIEQRLHFLRKESGQEKESIIQEASTHALTIPFILDRTQFSSIQVPPSIHHLKKL